MKHLLLLSVLAFAAAASAADKSQTATSVIAGPNAKRKIVTLAEAVTAGQPGYITSTGTAGLADGNVLAKAVVKGYFESGGSTGQKVNLVTEDDAANLGITNTIGDILILSATAGGIAPPADAATGMYVTVLGVAKSSTLVNFKPLASGAAIP
jgi:hypothetical protein